MAPTIHYPGAYPGTLPVRPCMSLAQALRAVADDLDQDMVYGDGSTYDWGSVSRCNCGLVVAKILGAVPPELNRWMRQYDGFLSEFGEFGSWSMRSCDMFCTSTGLPRTRVACVLAQAGLSAKEMVDLEYCRNATVLDRIGGRLIDSHKSRRFVARYMRAMADLWDTEGRGTLWL